MKIRRLKQKRSWHYLSTLLQSINQEFYISPSIGISRYPADGYDSNSLIQKAAQALFEVKEKGRAHYRFYQTHMKSSFPNYIIMESHLRKAIEKGEFYVHYQPQVNLSTGSIDSFEALIRWNNRKFGFVSPAQFIPLAEETGLIHQIGEWVSGAGLYPVAKMEKQGVQIGAGGHQHFPEAISARAIGRIPSILFINVYDSRLLHRN